MSTRTTVDVAMGRLRKHFRRDHYGPQQRIEPERALASVIGCSRQTLRAALDQLEKEGMLWRHVGRGTFMGPRPSREPVQPLVLFEMTSPAELMDARLAIEPAVAAAAARNATDADVAHLRELATGSCAATSWQAYELLDDAFHKAVAAATGNRLLMATLGTLSSVRGRSHWQRQHDIAFRAARKREYSLKQGRLHLRIVDAIARHDADAAHAAMHEHLQSIRSLFADGQRVSA